MQKARTSVRLKEKAAKSNKEPTKKRKHDNVEKKAPVRKVSKKFKNQQF